MIPYKPGYALCQGNEAVVLGALAAGVNFYAGYPITPSTEIAEGLSDKLPALGGTFLQMEDEIASLGACLGASLAGAKALTATSGPGFSLMQELIGFGCMAEIPVVIVNVMRLGPSTGQPTSASQGDVMQARWGTHGDHPIIVLTASSVEGAFHATVKAVSHAEKYRVPVILLLDEVVAHMREKITLPDPASLKVEQRPAPLVPPEWYVPFEATGTGVPPMSAFGDGYRYHVTGLIHDAQGFPTSDPDEMQEAADRLFMKIKRGFGEVCEASGYKSEGASLMLLAYGSVARSARAAVDMLREEGHSAGLIALDTLWPFPRALVERLRGQAERILVCEMNRGQVYREVWRVARGRWQVSKLTSVNGELFTPDRIADEAKGVMKWR